MPVNLTAPLPSDLHPVPGVKLGITQARGAQGQPPRPDRHHAGRRLGCGRRVHEEPLLRRPVQLCQERLAAGNEIRALVINTGNANARHR